MGRLMGKLVRVVPGVKANGHPALLRRVVQGVQVTGNPFRCLPNRVDVHLPNPRAHDAPHAGGPETHGSREGSLQGVIVTSNCG